LGSLVERRLQVHLLITSIEEDVEINPGVQMCSLRSYYFMQSLRHFYYVSLHCI